MTTGGSETEIGKAGDGGFVGIIDEVMIYSKALSADEVAQIFEAEGLPVHPQGKLATTLGTNQNGPVNPFLWNRRYNSACFRLFFLLV